jgi:hypothetical protein
MEATDQHFRLIAQHMLVVEVAVVIRMLALLAQELVAQAVVVEVVGMQSFQHLLVLMD